MNNTLDVVLGHVVNAGNCVWLKSVYFPPMDEACFLFTNTFFYFAYGLGVIVIASLFNFFIWGKAAKRLVREVRSKGDPTTVGQAYLPSKNDMQPVPSAPPVSYPSDEIMSL